MAQMSAMDAAFLAMERRNEPRHVGAVMLFGPSGDGALSLGDVRRLVGHRIVRMPTARRRVLGAPFGLGRPSWQDAPVDLDVHVRRHVLTAADRDDELAGIVARVHARHLDRSRPLWELHVIEGLPDARTALYAKVHTAAMDDTTGVDLMTALLDEDRAGTTIEPVAPLVEGPTDLYGRFVAPVPDQLRRAAGFPIRLAGRAVRAVGEQVPGLTDTWTEMVRRTPGLGMMARALPPEDTTDGREHPTGRAPRLSFNAPIGSSRRVALGALGTADVMQIRQDSGASFNEVLLTVCTGALRRWLLANDELPTSPLVGIVPVLVANGSRGSGHIAGIIMTLPTHIADPAARLSRTRESLQAAKQRHTATPASLQQDIAMFAPPVVATATARLLDAMPHRPFISPTVNLAISNVPGPRRAVRLAGRPLLSGHPVLSVSDLTPLHLGIQAGPDRVGLGAIACGDHVTELRSLMGAATIELAELASAVTAHAGRRRPSS